MSFEEAEAVAAEEIAIGKCFGRVVGLGFWGRRVKKGAEECYLLED